MRDADLPQLFRLFNEIGIIEQLGRSLFEARLPDGVLVSHFSVLNNLMRVADGRTPLQLAQAFQVPKTTMTHTLAGLEKRGWVEMRPNPDDKRSKQVWTTPEGRAFRDEAIRALTPDLEKVGAVVPPDTLDRLIADLTDLRVWMDANRD